MWPWSEIRALRYELGLWQNNAKALQTDVDGLRYRIETARGEHGVTLARLEVANRQIERLETDLEGYRSDHRRLVNELAKLAHGRTAGTLGLDKDPYAEDPRLPDVFVQPEDPDLDELAHSLTAETTELDGA
jgi:uncharacterized protein (DUF3084 family)